MILVLLALVSVISCVPLLKTPQRIEGQYIVKFNLDVTDAAIESYNQYAKRSGIVPRPFNFGARFRGVFVDLSQSQVLEHLVMDEAIDWIEENGKVSINQICLDQNDAVWGLSRISQVAPNFVSYVFKYNELAGEGVTSYIVDTGIRTTHTQFQTGRASWGTNTVDNVDSDCNGHGTHVAGTVAGVTYGVAKKANVVAVKVLDCSGSGSWEGVIAGLQWVLENALKPANANLSLGGGYTASVNAAVAAVVAGGIPVIVAAGNSNANACSYSPASEPAAITVGATDIGADANGIQIDVRAYYSNYGTCLDIFAPGTLVTSAWHTSDTATNRISGTSMASPHVAGVAALIQAIDPDITPTILVNRLISEGSVGYVTNPGTGSPNVLAYTNC